MIKSTQIRKVVTLLGAVGALISLTACSSHTASSRTSLDEVVVMRDNPRMAPGVVEYVWEEPMVDVIDVPPGLDPEGIYYLPAHQEVVEIRQGRYKYYRNDAE
jgi:hypothetical protein